MDASSGSTSIDINSLVNKIKQKFQTFPANRRDAEEFTIFRVPTHVRQKNKELYEPRMVTIGPYYHGNEKFQAMENQKYVYLENYLKRVSCSRTTSNLLEDCIRLLQGLEIQARKYYFDQVELSGDEFLKMMLLDGCFIIEFLIKWSDDKCRTPLFDVGWILPIIRSDLLLLENQIPFIVIQKLYELIPRSDPVPPIEGTSIANPVVSSIKPLEKMLSLYLSEGQEDLVIELDGVKHILHLYHLYYVRIQRSDELAARTCSIQGLLKFIKLVFVFLIWVLKLIFKGTKTLIIWVLKLIKGTKSNNVRSPRTIPSATELCAAGVIFKCKRSKSLLDINFQNGILEIPYISVEETRKSRLLNLVSFEQCNTSVGKHLTSYACFMGKLLKTTGDVTLLQEKGIIHNLLATEEELVSFFNWLTECSYLNYEEHDLKEVYIDVNRYYNDDYHKWWAMLKIKYFSNPWSLVSFLAATALLGLTVTQTWFTILSYRKQK